MRCFKKKYGVAIEQYFKTRYNTYNLHLDMCEVSTPYAKVTEVMNTGEVIGQAELGW